MNTQNAKTATSAYRVRIATTTARPTTRATAHPFTTSNQDAYFETAAEAAAFAAETTLTADQRMEVAVRHAARKTFVDARAAHDAASAALVAEYEAAVTALADPVVRAVALQAAAGKFLGETTVAAAIANNGYVMLGDARAAEATFAGLTAMEAMEYAEAWAEAGLDTIAELEELARERWAGPTESRPFWAAFIAGAAAHYAARLVRLGDTEFLAVYWTAFHEAKTAAWAAHAAR